jgi:hypothetical protein
MCPKKVYWTKADAKRARRIFQMKFEHESLSGIYWCEECSGFHLTTDKKKSRKITNKKKHKEKHKNDKPKSNDV